MWLINDCIIAAVMVLMIVSYVKERKALMLTTALTAYCILPVFKIYGFGLHIDLNSAYLVSLLLLILFFVEVFRKSVRIGKPVIVYAAGTLLIHVAYLIGWLSAGYPTWHSILTFIPSFHFMCAALLIGIFLSNMDKESMRSACKWSLILVGTANILFVILDFTAFDFAWKLTNLFYASDAEFAPLRVMLDLGYFNRGYGTFYTPVYFGSLFLLFSAALCGLMFQRKANKPYAYILVFAVVFAGLYAFTKTYILGVWTVLIALFACVVLHLAGCAVKKRRHPERDTGTSLGHTLKQAALRFALFALCFAIAFAGVAVSTPTKLHHQVEYYFGFMAKPFDALTSRYGPTGETNTPDDENMEPDAQPQVPMGGVTQGAQQVFLDHPVFGVGPNNSRGEFIGDSQYISILHHGGIVAFVLYGLLFGYLAISFLVKKEYSRLGILFALAVCCLSSLIFVSNFAIPFVGFLLCVDNDSLIGLAKLKSVTWSWGRGRTAKTGVLPENQ